MGKDHTLISGKGWDIGNQTLLLKTAKKGEELLTEADKQAILKEMRT